jgi:MFS family permease
MNKQSNSSRIWSVGTLNYTLSGVITLFFLLLLGDFSWSMKERSVFQMVQLLFKTYGASDFFNSVMIMAIPSALGLVINPIVGYRSDRCRTRFGRRIPYLLVSTPIAAGAMVGLAFSPLMGTALAGIVSMSENQVVLILLGIFWTIFEFATVVSLGIFTALVNDVVPSKLLGRFYGLFRALSLLAGIMFNYWLLGYAKENFAELFIAIGILYAIGFFVMCFRVKEGEYPPLPEIKERVIDQIKGYFTECYSKPYYLLVFAFYAAAFVMVAPMNAFSLFYSQSLNVPLDHYGKCIAISYLASLVLAYPLGVLVDRTHPLFLTIMATVLYGISSISGFFLITAEASFLIFFFLHTVLAGGFFTVSASLMQRLLPHEKFAEYASASLVISSLVYVIFLPIIGHLLDRSGHHYRFFLIASALFAGTAVILGYLVVQRFRQYGGKSSYLAP